jgi:Predicted membrane protein
MSSAVKVGRVILIFAFTLSGFAHLFTPEVFLPLMPPIFPEPMNWIYISGAMELIAALLLALKIQGGPTLAFVTLLAVWPGNWWMAIEFTQSGDVAGAVFAWARLPLQLFLFYFALKSPVEVYFKVPKKQQRVTAS